jgi:hypothetical protein
MDALDGLRMVDSAGRCYCSRLLVRRCAKLIRQVVPKKICRPISQRQENTEAMFRPVMDE